ncbi:MAG: ABC transporter ATP-binding protein [Clostridia bacterium]|nr:ABC transporter ATP-binding protein [Clostridia bacterium]
MDNNEKKPSRSAVIKNTIYAAKVITKASPFLLIGYTLSITGYWFFESYIKNVIFLEKMINTVTDGGTFRQFMLILLAFCGFGLIAHFLDCFGDYIASAENKKVYRMLNEQIFRKACQVDIECYENPKFYDNYKRATDVINNELSAEFSWTTGKFVSSAITAVGLVSYICSVDPIILIFLTGMIPYIASQSFRNKLEYKKDREMTSNNRKKDYVQRVVFLKDFSKDMRTSGIYSVMKTRFVNAVESNREIIKKYGWKTGLLDVIGGILTEIVPIAGTLIYGVYGFAVTKEISVAQFAVLISAVTSLKEIIENSGKCISEIQRCSLYFGNLREFFAYENRLKDGTIKADAIEKIEFRNVTFTYPGAKKPTLKNVSFTINKDETVAIVGKNGAGKSTFVKLLLRFYDPEEGEILYNGVNVKEYEAETLRKKIGTVFQDYKVFALSVNENVLCREAENDEDRLHVEKALKKSGVYDKISTFEKGADTVLTKEFDDNGTGLSGGEQQKVAAARMFAHPFDLAVLDEPSSALDPIAEYKMYESLIEETVGKMVVYISHRLSSAVLSDRIYVFENGTVAESGSHTELMAKNGVYAEMFTMQASNYKDEEGEDDE